MDSPVIVDKASEFGEPIDLDRPFPGFPFDDDSFGRRSDIRAHLDDLAARHPEFADHLLGPPWGDIPFQGSFRNRNRGSGNGGHNYQQQQGYSDEDARSQASGSSATSGASGSSHGEAESNQNQQSQTSEQTPKKNQIPQYGLRNTVDIGQHHHNMENTDKGNRGQRSMSAPPENRQSFAQPQPQPQEQQSQQPSGQRYVSRIDITPQHNQAPQQPQQQQPQKPQQQGNVRHIPIFVEGRDEPVLPRSFDEPPNFRREPSPTQFHTPPHFQRSAPFGDVFGGRHQWSPHFQDTFYQQPSSFEHPSRRQQQPSTFQQPKKPQQQQYEQPKQQQQQQKPQQHSQPQPQQQQEPPPKPKPTLPKDPLERVALIQKEIDSLAEQVKQYTGNSRTDKHYMYLDEMLTRELIKLDDIETEGRDNVRQARKNAIKTIQETISLLESRAPLPTQQTSTEEKKEEEEQVSNDSEKVGQSAESMDVEQKSENQEAGKAEKTEVAESEKKEENQSKEPIPLPPCPSTEGKPEETKESPANVPNDQTANQQQETSQTSGDAMDTTSNEKSKPAEAQPNTENVEEKKADTVDEQKKPESVVEHKAEEKPAKGKKKDASEKTENKKEEEKMEVDSEVKQSPKTQKKGKKTKKQAAVSDKAIPLPAPEDTAASAK
ncbi:BAG domain-containing protein Samui-like isoform X2 [Osmia bicornis bicornis]|uniref:BAG domain-containing protein Samui-like isoform X2 n=1 Tax=Osmia bicornis bicornis TaxID=1437191 RepID=UPI001EAF13FF|nr:BAG domain-containing protein Samui-like isoform X2 [Osmia bicornis bicornis]